MARTKQTTRKAGKGVYQQLKPALSGGSGGGGKKGGGSGKKGGGDDKPDAPVEKSEKHGYCWCCGKEGRVFARRVQGDSYEVCSVCIKKSTELIRKRFLKNKVSFF